MNRCIQIGKFFSRRYLGQNGIPTSYDSDHFLFYSTHINRAKESQFSVAHGFFGNTSGPVYPDGYDEAGQPLFDTGLTPIPSISTLEHNTFVLLAASLWFFSLPFFCFCIFAFFSPTALRLAHEHESSEVFTNFHNSHAEVYARLFNQTGYTTSGYDITNVVDALMYIHDLGCVFSFCVMYPYFIILD